MTDLLCPCSNFETKSCTVSLRSSLATYRTVESKSFEPSFSASESLKLKQKTSATMKHCKVKTHAAFNLADTVLSALAEARLHGSAYVDALPAVSGVLLLLGKRHFNRSFPFKVVLLSLDSGIAVNDTIRRMNKWSLVVTINLLDLLQSNSRCNALHHDRSFFTFIFSSRWQLRQFVQEPYSWA